MNPVEMTETAVLERLDRIASATEKLLNLLQVLFVLGLVAGVVLLAVATNG